MVHETSDERNGFGDGGPDTGKFEEDAPRPHPLTLPVGEIREDRDIQPREIPNAATVHDYAELMREGVTFPPLDVFAVGDDHLLTDGYQRLAAARIAGLKTVEVRVHAGARRDAILFAAGANARHGLPLSSSDKRRVVSRLLQDDEWSNWVSREIARHVAVSHTFVDQVRAKLATVASKTRKYTRSGKPGKMKTDKIGKSRSKTGGSKSNVVSNTRQPEDAPRTTPVTGITRKPEDAPEGDQVNLGSIDVASISIQTAVRCLTNVIANALKTDPVKVAQALRKSLPAKEVDALFAWLDQVKANRADGAAA